MSRLTPFVLTMGFAVALVGPTRARGESTDAPKSGGRTLTGKDALGDWTTDAPGVRRRITVNDLATPYETPSAINHSRVAGRPEAAWPNALEGFAGTRFATRPRVPRVFLVASNV